MKSPRRTTLALSVLAAAALSSLMLSLPIMPIMGCAGVKRPDTGTGGSSGSMPAIPNLLTIQISPGSQSVSLNSTGGASLTASASFTATGTFRDGHTEDVTSRVGWPSQFRSLHVQSGTATVTAPGKYTITAASGSVMGTAMLTATFSGNRYGDGFDPGQAGGLDATPAGTATIAYPLDGSVFPPNLSPVQVHVSRTTPAQTVARINFTSEDVVNVSYYANCQAGAGIGCYVDLPLEVTQLFIAVSESHDIKLTARVGGSGAPLAESASINVAWANVPLSGGLYYWTTMADGVVPGYTSPRNTDGTPATGTGIQRYDFGQDGVARPQLVYTDKGRSPTFYGSPPATADGAQCIGCHAISNDGKTMALTIGGSGASDISLLDLTTLTMTVLDAQAAGGSTSLMDINYYKQFRKSGVATETTFGPNGDVMVNMYKSGLVLHGTNASLVNQGAVVQSWGEPYKSDPFWSQSGKLFVFTSFTQADVGTYNPLGTNGDMKKGGQIVIASAGNTSVNDDAHVLVPREANVTKYYPAVSNDDKLVVYNQSTCAADPDAYTIGQVGIYGSQTCDGYDDSSATLWLISPDGGHATKLDRANGTMPGGFPITKCTANEPGCYDNSWPRWSPDNGMFRGQRLYWLAFSSRRPYGLQVNNTSAPLSTKPQIWFAAILVGADVPSVDPSYPPIWLPNQNPTAPGTVPNQVPTGNHVPQWVKVAVPIPG
jgi:hypothetical protein